MKFLNYFWPWNRIAALENELREERRRRALLEQMHANARDSLKKKDGHMRSLATILAAKGGFILWMLSIVVVNGQGLVRGGLDTNATAVQAGPLILTWPFVGYSGAANTGLVYKAVTFGNSSNSALLFSENYENNTNTDGSINTVFRRGYNQNPNSGPTVSRLGSLVEQMEYHYIAADGTPLKEWHRILIGTNDTEYRMESVSFNETNGRVGQAFGYDFFTMGPHTNPANAAVLQGTIEYNVATPLMHLGFNNGSFLDWTYPNGQGIMIQAENSASATVQLHTWDAVNTRYQLIPNGGASLIIGGLTRFNNNSDIGTSDYVWSPNNIFFTGNAVAKSTGAYYGNITPATNNVVTKSADYAILTTDDYVLLSGNHTATLPAPATAIAGREFTVICTSAGTNGILRNSSESITGPNITGATKWTNGAVGKATVFVTDGANWFVKKTDN